jgi:hypothetical protein
MDGVKKQCLHNIQQDKVLYVGGMFEGKGCLEVNSLLYTLTWHVFHTKKCK